MSNIRLKDKTEALVPATDDYLYLDGLTNGVRKLAKTYYAPATSSVVGPASASSGHIAVFADSTGKLLQDSGYLALTGVNVSSGSGDVGKIPVLDSTGKIDASFLSGSALQLSAMSVAGVSITGNVPFTSISTDHTTTLGEGNTGFFHTGSDASARTWTINSLANVPATVGTSLTFANGPGAGNITITVNTGSGGSLVLVGSGNTGNRTLGVCGIATAILMPGEIWMINGSGLS